MANEFLIGSAVALSAPKKYPVPLVNPDIYESVSFLAENKLDCMELHLEKPTEVVPEQLIEYVNNLGLTVTSIGTGLGSIKGGLSLISKNCSVRRAAIDRLKAHIDLAEKFGGLTVILGSIHGARESDMSKKEADGLFIDACNEIAEYIEPKRSQIAVEPINPYRINYLNTVDEVLECIDKINSSKFGVLIDTYHVALTENSWETPFLRAGSRLYDVHAVENNRHYPGDGIVDFKTIIQTLRKIEYKGPLIMEINAYPDGKTAVLKGYEHLKKLFD